MADSPEELRQEFEEYSQAEASIDSGLESAPNRSALPAWIKWMIIADLVIIAAVVLIVLGL